MIVKKPSTDHLNQVVRITITSYRIQQQHLPPDMIHWEEHNSFSHFSRCFPLLNISHQSCLWINPVIFRGVTWSDLHLKNITLVAKGEWSEREESGIWGADIVFTKSDGTDACSVPSFPLWRCVPYKLVQETFKSLGCLCHPPISSLICFASPRLLCWIPWAPLVIIPPTQGSFHHPQVSSGAPCLLVPFVGLPTQPSLTSPDLRHGRSPD